MVQKMSQKLKSRSGMSILLALGLVLICTMVTSSILMAAASGSSRHMSRTVQQQSYLAVSSAATLAVEELKEIQQFSVKAEKTNHTTCGGLEGCAINPLYPAYTDNPDEPTVLGGSLGGLIQKACEAFADPNRSTSSDDAFQAYIDMDTGDARLPVVTCTFTMYSSYVMTMVFAAPDSDYRVTVAVDVQQKLERENTAMEMVPCCTHGLTDYTCEHAVKTLLVTWQAPTVEKGGSV